MSELRDRVFAATGLRSAAIHLRREATECAQVGHPAADLINRIAERFELNAEDMVRGHRRPGLDPDWLLSLGVDETSLG